MTMAPQLRYSQCVRRGVTEKQDEYVLLYECDLDGSHGRRPNWDAEPKWLLRLALWLGDGETFPHSPQLSRPCQAQLIG